LGTVASWANKEEVMLQPIPVPYSAEAADSADRLRLLKCDIRTAELALERFFQLTGVGTPASNETSARR
jgi:hypothetical protein